MKKILFLFTVCLFIFAKQTQAKQIDLASPNGEIKVMLNVTDKIRYTVSYNNEQLLTDCYLQLSLEGHTLGDNPKLIKSTHTTVNETLTPVFPLKYSSVSNHYNQLRMSFKGNYVVEFRAYNNGIAYRFVTNNKTDAYVTGENFVVNFPTNYLIHAQQPRGFKTAYEEPYTHIESNEWKPEDRMSVLPILIDTRKEYKILISEADLYDYPCMFLKGTGTNSMRSTFPKVPLEFGEDGDRSLKIRKEADYIAHTSGKRNYPWRYFVITKDDKELIENTLTYQLSTKNKLEDTSWIKPGQVSWEWWNDASPYGPDVDFVSGYNLETYKYYIDFASKFGIPYIIMDEGWAMSTRDPYTPNPKVDVHELIRYGKEKNVGIVLWLTWLVVENNFDIFKTFQEWGVKGIKIDFMDRSDQWMVNYYERVAREAAKHKLFVDFHGSFKPAGLEYAYPNVLSYEGVRGMEQMGGCYPDNSIYFPFMRNAVGPMDYTPGAMISMQPNVYSAQRPNSGSIGTRAYQMALFVIFESALQMLADNPTLYYRNLECTEFITKVPTTWDETRVLAAKAGEYAIVAKRKGDKWYIGGMTNNKEKERTFDINFDFLGKDKVYNMTHFEDGINAGRQAMDYRKKNSTVRNGDKITIKMVRNGGWAAVIEATTPDPFWHTTQGTYEQRRELFLDYCVKSGERKKRIGIFTQIARVLSNLKPEEELVQDAIDKIRSNWDCNDFSLNGLLRFAYMQKEKPQLSPTLSANMEECILDFKYWWNDARPDTTYRCYHTENHQALYHTAELLAGQLYKERTFSSGLTGAQHIAHAEHLLNRWLDFRFRFGFSEWLSTYYEVEIMLLLNIHDYAENQKLKEKAKSVLDVLMLDIALGNFHGIIGTTSGRAYAHSLITGHHALSPTLKLLFGEGQYLPDAIMANVCLAHSNYRCPQIIADIATDYSKPVLNRQKISIEVDEAERYGLSPDSEEDTHLFWGMQEFIHPRVVKMSKQMSEKYGTYPYRNYDDYILRYEQQISKHGKVVNNRLDRFALSEANIGTLRTNDYMLSCANDYRAGAIGYQQHIWQASLGNEAVVFTTHPGHKGLGGSPNYWGGSAVMPRAVMHKNTVICIYNIPGKEGLPFSHAYFPRQAFDEVIERDKWVFARKGNGYVALYSQQPTQWKSDEKGNINDLAVSNRSNIWICETGSKAEWGEFNKFVAAISKLQIQSNGLNVEYQSPSKETIRFGWDAPFSVNEEETPLKTDYRYNNPYSKTLFDPSEISISKDGHTISLRAGNAK